MYTMIKRATLAVCLALCHNALGQTSDLSAVVRQTLARRDSGHPYVSWTHEERQEAIKRLTSLLATDPNGPYALGGRAALGDLYDADGDRDSALRVYQAIYDDPKLQTRPTDRAYAAQWVGRMLANDMLRLDLRVAWTNRLTALADELDKTTFAPGALRASARLARLRLAESLTREAEGAYSTLFVPNDAAVRAKTKAYIGQALEVAVGQLDVFDKWFIENQNKGVVIPDPVPVPVDDSMAAAILQHRFRARTILAGVLNLDADKTQALQNLRLAGQALASLTAGKLPVPSDPFFCGTCMTYVRLASVLAPSQTDFANLAMPIPDLHAPDAFQVMDTLQFALAGLDYSKEGTSDRPSEAQKLAEKYIAAMIGPYTKAGIGGGHLVIAKPLAKGYLSCGNKAAAQRVAEASIRATLADSSESPNSRNAALEWARQLSISVANLPQPAPTAISPPMAQQPSTPRPAGFWIGLGAGATLTCIAVVTLLIRFLTPKDERKTGSAT
jgi:tetratricopeptide (TPR) repeat protein